MIKKHNLAIVGTGKIAHSFTAALNKVNQPISIVVGRELSKVKIFAKRFSVNNFSEELSSLSGFTGLIFLAVPDNEIETVAAQLAKVKLKWKSISVIHFSGSLTVKSLNVVEKLGAKTGSMHIMQSFPSIKVVSIVNSFAAIETNNLSLKKKLFTLAKSIKLNPFEIKTEQKSLYHLTGVFVSNFMVANIYLAESLFKKTGIKNVSFLELMKPIINATQENIFSSGIEKALSGPIERGDVKTIELHIKSLEKFGTLAEIEAFIILSIALLKMLKTKNQNLTKGQKTIEKLLNQKLKSLH
jgi:predicted short-subunit dehydrogenase-like oxidoreductase (DUF2520 family)